MKIYTRTGDKGETGLLGGKRVPKDDPRIEAYGTVDELNSNLGMLRDLAAPHETELLIGMQQMLFAIGSHLSSSSTEESTRFHVPPILETDITALEQAMDRMESSLEPMRNFILPGGHVAVSQAHICRTVCRRAERRVVALSASAPVDPVLVRYLNRASDLFFMLARYLAHQLGVQETPWKPRG